MTFKPSKAIQAVKKAIRVHRPLILWGPPGIGKSDIVRQVGVELDRRVEDIRALLLDPVDLRGLPSVTKGVTQWNVPDFLPSEGEGILFLDELPAAPPMTQAALYQLILDRRIGDYILPDGWDIIAAGNREQDGAVSHRMPTALRNRFIHLELEPDIQDWSEWAVTGGTVEPVVIAFLRSRPELLHKFDKNDRAFPTPRSWCFVSDLLSDGQGIDQETEHGMICGTVGEGAAIEFSAYLRLFRDLPSPEEILMNPKTAIVPKSAATLYAVASAIARFISVSNIGRAMVYLSRIPDEYGILCIQDAIRRDRALTKTDEYVKWVVKNQSVLM